MMTKGGWGVAVASLLLLPASAVADAPSKRSLIEAWEAHMAAAPGTLAFERSDDNRYHIEDENLPYEGELRLAGALVRPMEALAGETQFTHMGIVELDLVDLPEGRRHSQSFYYWAEDRQTFYYSQEQQAWLDTGGYQAAFQDYVGPGSFQALSFMLNYGVWILLIALLVWVFVAVSKQGKKARALMDDSASINLQARENLDRSEKIQKEMIDLARRTFEVQSANHRLLEQILEALRR